jgi:hypothetical protein
MGAAWSDAFDAWFGTVEQALVGACGQRTKQASTTAPTTPVVRVTSAYAQSPAAQQIRAALDSASKAVKAAESAGKHLSAASVDEFQKLKARCRSLLEENQRLEAALMAAGQAGDSDALSRAAEEEQKQQEERLAEAGKIIEALSALIRRDLRLTDDAAADANERWPTGSMPRARSSSSLQETVLRAASVRRAMRFAAVTGPTTVKGPTVKRTALGPKSPNLR